MSAPATINTIDPATLDASANLETVLAVWHNATVRLEETHNALRGEVRRLTDELEEKNRQLARKNRLADLGQIASHVAHEVRNSLVSVTLHLSLLRRQLVEDADKLRIVDRIGGDLTALDATVKDLLSFSSQGQPHLEPVEPRRLIEEVFESLRPQMDAQHIETTIEVGSEVGSEVGGEPSNENTTPIMLDADPELLRRVIINLTLNALDAMIDGGRLVARVGRSLSGGVDLTFVDSGGGLSDDVLRRLFEPFFTTKGAGTGLGLAIVYHVVEHHGGTVTAANAAGGGAQFSLHFPHRLSEAAA